MTQMLGLLGMILATASAPAIGALHVGKALKKGNRCVWYEQVELSAEDIALVSVDRSSTSSWSANIMVNAIPTLTWHNCYLFVMDVRGIIHRTPDSSREFFRKLSAPERLGAQGFHTSLAMDLSPASAL